MKLIIKRPYRIVRPKESRKFRLLKKIGYYTYLVLNNPYIQAAMKQLLQKSMQLLLWFNKRFNMSQKLKIMVMQGLKMLLSMDNEAQVSFYILSIGSQFTKIILECFLLLNQQQ